jgi:hypothetical protein
MSSIVKDSEQSELKWKYTDSMTVISRAYIFLTISSETVQQTVSGFQLKKRWILTLIVDNFKIEPYFILT